MKKILIFFLFLTSCVANQSEVNNNNFLDLKYNEDLSFDEFKIKLEVYAVNSPYPNIDD